MNLLKKPYGLTLQALLWVMIFGCLLAHPFTNATSSPPGDKREYVLIINSYNESSSWSWEIITDITARIEQIENLEVYVEHMNMLLMDQQSDLDNFRANLAREYGKNPPRMLIYIGAPAFTMRDFAEKEWGKGIPSIICAEEDFIGPDKYYVSKQAIPHSERIPLRKLNGEYNLTLLYAPIYLEQTIELMRRMIPEMNRLVFVRDGRYINQQADSDLRELLDREFPQIDYRFYSAHEMSTEALLDSLNRIDIHRTGILFSSWHYTKKIGDNIVSVTDSYRVIASVQAPMFALMPADIRDGGLVGGYVYDDAEVNAHVISTIDAVLAGHQPRDIPFYAPQDARPVFNYAALERKDLSPHTCPANTLFYNKPVSTLEQYKWAIGGVVLLLAFIFFAFAFTDLVKGNGYLAVYLAGLVVGNHKLAQKRSLTVFFDGFTWLMQIVMFLTLGLFVNSNELLEPRVLILGGLVGAFMILVARPLTVFICMAPFRKFTTKARLYVSWVGLRGAVPILFAIYPLMAHVENAGLLFNVVFLGTIISLLVQGTTVSGMANLLGLAYEERESAFNVEMHEEMKSALTEVEVNENLLASGHTLKDITLPENTLVMMVCRDGEYFVPQGKTELKLGDKLLVISDRSEELASTYKDMGIDDVMKLG